MNIDRLYEFQILAQTLHYGLAASRLYISQSILSRHIQSLENELGVQLFERTSHSVELTNAGRAFYRLSQDFTKNVQQTKEAARVAGLGLGGSVKIAILLPTMSARFKEFLCRFQDRYPDIFIWADIIANIELPKISGYHFLTLPSSAMQITDEYEVFREFQEEASLALPEGHRVRPAGTISLADLAEETLFLPGYDRRVGSYAQIGQLARKMTNDHIQIVSVPTPETALLNVEMGRGFTIIPKYRMNTFVSRVRYSNIAEECSFSLFLMKNVHLSSAEGDLFAEEFSKIMS